MTTAAVNSVQGVGVSLGVVQDDMQKGRGNVGREGEEREERCAVGVGGEIENGVNRISTWFSRYQYILAL
jgi:hypothetical protein